MKNRNPMEHSLTMHCGLQFLSDSIHEEIWLWRPSQTIRTNIALWWRSRKNSTPFRILHGLDFQTDQSLRPNASTYMGVMWKNINGHFSFILSLNAFHSLQFVRYLLVYPRILHCFSLVNIIKFKVYRKYMRVILTI